MRAVMYRGYGVMPELADVAGPAARTTGWSSASARPGCAGLTGTPGRGMTLSRSRTFPGTN